MTIKSIYSDLGLSEALLETVRKITEDDDAYQKFFRAELKKRGVESPEELSKDDRKKFYDYIDAHWKAKDAKADAEESENPSKVYVTFTKQLKDGSKVNNQRLAFPDSAAAKSWIASAKKKSDLSDIELHGELAAVNEDKLSYQDRKNMSPLDFIFPKDKKYPDEDKSHARDALSRVSASGTPAEKAKVRAAVKSKYPDMKVSEEKADNESMDDSNKDNKDSKKVFGKKSSKIDTEPMLERSFVPDDESDAGDKNIIMQLRKVVSTNGAKSVEFNDGKKETVTPRVAHAILDKFSDLRPADKEKMQNQLCKSKSEFDKVVGTLSEAAIVGVDDVPGPGGEPDFGPFDADSEYMIAYNMGKKARNADSTPRECPYGTEGADSVLRRAWLMGFADERLDVDESFLDKKKDLSEDKDPGEYRLNDVQPFNDYGSIDTGSKPIQNAYLAGMTANQQGKHVKDNPFLNRPVNDGEQRAWLAGYFHEPDMNEDDFQCIFTDYTHKNFPNLVVKPKNEGFEMINEESKLGPWQRKYHEYFANHGISVSGRHNHENILRGNESSDISEKKAEEYMKNKKQEELKHGLKNAPKDLQNKHNFLLNKMHFHRQEEEKNRKTSHEIVNGYRNDKENLSHHLSQRDHHNKEYEKSKRDYLKFNNTHKNKYAFE